MPLASRGASALRQRTLNKTAINKDEVRIRTADSFNQIRDIKVPSKAKEKDERTERWTREEPVQGGGRHSSRGGCEELASISRIRTPKTKSHPCRLLFLPTPESLRHLLRTVYPRLLVLPDTGSLKESSWAWSPNRVPIIYPSNVKLPTHEIRRYGRFMNFTERNIIYF